MALDRESRVLVTGGSGFIGTNLLTFLREKGLSVRNLDMNPPIHPAHRDLWIEQDILDADGTMSAIREFSPTHVVHLAARTDLGGTTLQDYAANSDGVRNVLRALNDIPEVQRVVIASSMLVCKLGYVPQSEQDYCPPNPYGESKVLTEKVTRDFGLKPCWTLIRPTTVWGPWSIRYRDEFFRTLKSGRYLHPGKARIMKSYGYVGNVVNQIFAILEAPVSSVNRKTFYVGDQPIELREWVDGFSVRLTNRKVRVVPLGFIRLLALAGDGLGALGVRFPVTRFRLSNMTTDNVVDVGPIQDIAGAGPYSIDDGISETVRWLNSH